MVDKVTGPLKRHLMTRNAISRIRHVCATWNSQSKHKKKIHSPVASKRF